MMTGYVHSIDSFGTVDGPGIRYVVFLQGCPLRCLYCHNPDTWEVGQGTPMTAEEIIASYNKNRAFYSKGGITVTGGEPLLQLPFLVELFSMAKAQNIHTCLDTSGVTFKGDDPSYLEKLDCLLANTDLVLLDIKHTDADEHRKLTGRDNRRVLRFAKYLEEKKTDVWIRHVVIPGYTDGEEGLKALGHLIAGLSNVKALDILPYHTLGVSKYQELGLSYPLDGVEALPKESAQKAKQIVLNAIRESRRLHKTK